MRVPWERAGQTRFDRLFVPVTIGALVGLVALLLVLLVRTPRDTVVLEVSRQSDPSQISVWVGGEVIRPGLYQLPRGSRVSDAIDAAGGLTVGTDANALPMAQVLADSDEIVVAGRPTAQSAPIANVAETSPPQSDAGSGEADLGPININTADAGTLESLPGVGPAIAGRIIEYRNTNGGFTTVDELEAVAGISARMVDEYRPFITVGQ